MPENTNNENENIIWHRLTPRAMNNGGVNVREERATAPIRFTTRHRLFDIETFMEQEENAIPVQSNNKKQTTIHEKHPEIQISDEYFLRLQEDHKQVILRLASPNQYIHNSYILLISERNDNLTLMLMSEVDVNVFSQDHSKKNSIKIIKQLLKQTDL